MKRLPRRAAIAFGLVAVAFPAASAKAQSGSASTNASYYLGYSGNLPHQELGAVFGRIREQR